MSEKKVYVVMPVVGKPYIVSDREVNLKNTQEIVGGLYSNVDSPIYNDLTNLFGIVAIITKEKHLEGIGLPYKGFLCDEEESDDE